MVHTASDQEGYEDPSQSTMQTAAGHNGGCLYSPATKEAKAGRLRVQGHPHLNFLRKVTNSPLGQGLASHGPNHDKFQHGQKSPRRSEGLFSDALETISSVKGHAPPPK